MARGDQLRRTVNAIPGNCASEGQTSNFVSLRRFDLSLGRLFDGGPYGEIEFILADQGTPGIASRAVGTHRYQ